jgi:diguanylate cyclase (GGDEF)-like protein
MWLSITALRSGSGTVVHYLGHGRNPNRLNDLDPQLERLSHYDPLTNLPNRRFARSRLEQELALAARRGTIGAVLCLDLDHFKNVNDALGHQAGDTLLVTVAERLRGTLRAEDTAACQGDDEFVILLAPEVGGVDAIAHNAYVVARKILDAMARPLHIGEHELRVGASIGIALYTGRENDAEAVLRQADGAMNRAKGSRGSIHFFSDDMQIEADRRLLVNSELRAAVAREQLRLVFQPQVDAGGAIIGAEALVRWQHPQHGLIPPGEFLPIAEDLGLAPIVDWWVLAAACRQLAGWRAQGLLPAGCVLAINVSAQLVASEDFVAGVQATLAESGAPAESLVLELTERSLLHDPDNVARKMNRLRELGLRFSVDDFGTGYSSLLYLKQLPIDSLKVDRSFVRDLPRDDHDAAIVNATLGLAFNLGLDVVAEGVETEAQLAFLIERGCRMFQGFHFSPPVDRETFEHMLTNGGCTAI